MVRVGVYHYCPPAVGSNDTNSYDIAPSNNDIVL